MKDSRKGESLWHEWEGDLYPLKLDESIVFYTETHVDVEHEVVRRALASTLQRSGIFHSLSEGFNAIANGEVNLGYAGCVGGDYSYTYCDADGITEYGDTVDEIIPVTYVEVVLP